MKVIFSREALSDIGRISEYIATDSPRRALTFVRELVDAAVQVEETPLAYGLIPRYEHSGIRRKPYRAYLIFYTVEANRVGIVHILHSSQDYEAILFAEE